MTSVMIVEDEPLLRKVGAEVLGHAGYEIIEACADGEAMDMLEHRSDVRSCSQISECRAPWMDWNLQSAFVRGGQ